MSCLEDKSFKLVMSEEKIKQYHICSSLFNNNNNKKIKNGEDKLPRKLINVDENGSILIELLEMSSSEGNSPARVFRLARTRSRSILKCNSSLSLVSSENITSSLKTSSGAISPISNTKKTSRFSIAKTNSRLALRSANHSSFHSTILVAIGFETGLDADVTFELSINSPPTNINTTDLVAKILNRLNSLIDCFNADNKNNETRLLECNNQIEINPVDDQVDLYYLVGLNRGVNEDELVESVVCESFQFSDLVPGIFCLRKKSSDQIMAK